MAKIKSVITACEIVTAYGENSAACWSALISGKSAIGGLVRFPVVSFQSKSAATVAGLTYLSGDSLVMQMLSRLLKSNQSLLPSDAVLMVASTTGEIDILEKQVLEGRGDSAESTLSALLGKVKTLIGNQGEATVISSACASSSAALGFASSLIQSGKRDCVLVAAADAVTEFVFSGFSSLMALDPDRARPFDKNRAGLSLGEGAGFVLLMSQARAEREKRAVLGEIAGWAVAGDANHMTGPSREASGLRLAIQKALRSAGVSSDDVGCISSHGTGTQYNDAMEMKAYKSIFADKPVPLYSIKGGLGHTMGAAGLIETAVALCVLQEKTIPPTVGLRDIDPEAKDWALTEKRSLKKNVILLNNAGFGGVNAALVLKQ